MLRRTLNLGILAHVDAGKTTLTERLLYAAGVIDAPGSVDAGTTQTDSLALERRRGITIKSAVVSFTIGDVTVNLIDTPGHPDFIAEVERVLGVLDGAVLVISAVEGVQPQTRLLMRALQRLGVPTLVFVNKIDRPGADDERVLREIEERLTPAVVPMGSATGLGSRAAAFATFGQADSDLARQAKAGEVHPVFFGSALTGAGADELTTGIEQLLPARAGDPGGALSGCVFKIERGATGDRIAFVRLFSGTLHVRDRLDTGKVTALRVFADGDAAQRDSVSAGEIAKLWGSEARIGDCIGGPRGGLEHHFDPPTLEAVVSPANSAEAHRLRVALEQLAEQDPLIAVRQDDEAQLSVSLYGEVQKEVIQATLADDYGLDVEFSEVSTICVERPRASGQAVEILNTPGNPFHADLGFRIDPAAPGSGVELRLDIEPRNAPLYVFKGLEGFAEHMEEYVLAGLQEGLFGWQVTDCVVTMTAIAYSLADGPPSRRGPMPTAADMKKLTPIVLLEALDDGGSVVCEPYLRVRLEVPTATLGAVISAAARIGAAVETPSPKGELSTIETLLPATRATDLQRQLAGLTGGEGVLESEFEGYRPVAGDPPERRRTRPNPLNRKEYLRAVR